MSQQSHHFESAITKPVRLDYLLYLPKGYGEDAVQRWPLILFLHGSGERGNDLDLVKLYGLPKKIEAGADLPFIVVSPQCPADSYWLLHLDDLKALADDAAARYAVDPNRIYLTGLSMGGTGTWTLCAAYPEFFAAIIPICGRGMFTMGNRLKHTPAWIFHGEDDEVIPVSESRRMAQVLQEAGGDVTLTLYPGVGHDSWTRAYDNPDIYTWLLRHSR
jgi:predicted peptidase